MGVTVTNLTFGWKKLQMTTNCEPRAEATYTERNLPKFLLGVSPNQDGKYAGLLNAVYSIIDPGCLVSLPRWLITVRYISNKVNSTEQLLSKKIH